MNRRRALLWMLPLVAAAVPVWEHVARRRRAGGGTPAGGFHGAYFPDLGLRTHDGERVRLYDDLIRGRTVLVHFLEPSCAEPGCVAITENLGKLQRALGERCGRDVFLYSLTRAGGRDSAGRLQRFREQNGLKAGWTLLSGSERSLERCRQCFGLGEPGAWRHAGEPPHANVVVIGNEPHQRWLAAPALTDPEVLLEKLDRVAGIRS